jgi:hypothetical protein
VSAPAVVQSLSGGEVRADCPGFLRTCHVSPGQQVRAGDPVATLENPEQTTALHRAEIDAALSRLRRDSFLAAENLAGYRAESQNLAALDQKLEQLRTRVAGLCLRSARNGVVIARDLNSLSGTWVQTGQLLLTIADPSTRELLILAPQGDIEAFRSARENNRPARFVPLGRPGLLPVEITRIAPSATAHPPHFALITPFQGPLPIRKTDPATRNANAPPKAALDGFELTEPHFALYAHLHTAASEWLADGELGHVTVSRGSRLSLGARLFHALEIWLTKLSERQNGSA